MVVTTDKQLNFCIMNKDNIDSINPMNQINVDPINQINELGKKECEFIDICLNRFDCLHFVFLAKEFKKDG